MRKLSKDVFSESTNDGGIVVDKDNKNNIDTATTASESSSTRKCRTYNTKGRPLPSSTTKEKVRRKFSNLLIAP